MSISKRKTRRGLWITLGVLGAALIALLIALALYLGHYYHADLAAIENALPEGTTFREEPDGSIVFEPEVGAIYTGRVTRIIPIGAFVEFAPGKEGMVHISKLDTARTEKVEDICNVGDEIRVKYLGTDEKGRMNLSRRDAL